MIKVVCAWHPIYFAKEPALVIREFPDQSDETSHGICEACKARFRVECEQSLTISRGPLSDKNSD